MGEQLLRDAAAVLQPGFVNDDSGRVPDWVRRALTEDQASFLEQWHGPLAVVTSVEEALASVQRHLGRLR